MPAKGTDLRTRIWAGSGVVGSEVRETERLRLDFEGDPEVFPTFTDRVRRAAERHCWDGPDGGGYPTRACAYADRGQVVRVGTYDTEAGKVTVSEEKTLADWLGLERPEDLTLPSC